MQTSFKRGRDREAAIVRRAYRAASVGQLMLGELRTWEEFLQPEIDDLAALPRRVLRSRREELKKRLQGEIAKFCRRNFADMNESKLSQLYREIKASRGLVMPLDTFEQKFSPILPDARAGAPAHANVHISLWGLKFWFPEDQLAKDLRAALEILRETSRHLEPLENTEHADLRSQYARLKELVRYKSFASRSAVLMAFNLLESYLNGIAWDFARQPRALARLSKKKQKLINDTSGTSIADKMCKYPEIISGRQIDEKTQELLKVLIETVKPYRDSLVHASPFSAPEKFGGYNKLRIMYRVDVDTAQLTITMVIDAIHRINAHLHGPNVAEPRWLWELGEANETKMSTPQEWENLSRLRWLT
jgi:hypothetical protein